MLKDLCFEVIQTCPNKCMFCSSNSCKEADKIIEEKDFERTVKYFLDNGGIEEISISGGEPFLHPDLFKMIEFCKKNGIRTVVFTSGLKRSGKISEEERQAVIERRDKDLAEIEEHEPENERLKRGVRNFYDRALNVPEFTAISNEEFLELKRLGLDKIVFDWQAFETETDNHLMGRKDMNTQLFTSIIRARKNGLNVDVHFIPMKLNYRQFPDILECLEMTDVDNISILNFVPQGRGKENKDQLMLSPEELKEFGEILNKSRESFSGKIRIGIPLKGNLTHLCTAGTEKLDIKFDGTVLPCPAFKEISQETMKKYGIRLHNIYEDLEEVVVRGGKRKNPLCKQVYGFNGKLSEGDER